MYADELPEPWLEPLRLRLPGLELFDCHTHVGVNDPSGFSVTREQLLDSLQLADSRAAVFALKEPDGYRDANLRAVQLAAEHPERLVAFCRIDPTDEPLERAEEALSAGARGLKLHPDGEQFDIGDARLEDVYQLADQRALPVIIHAGAEVDGVGRTALQLCERFPGARLILAHDALTDLSWIWEKVDEHPNLFFDTSWWGPVHTLALFALVPPGRVLSASDLPYCSPLSGALTTLRCGIQAGLSDEQLRLTLGAQFQRLLEGEEPVDAGTAPGAPHEPLDPLLERVFVTLLTGLESIESELLKSTPGITGVDPSHVMIETASIGMTGYRALDWLREQRNIDVERVDHRRIMPLVSFAHGEAEIDRLVRSLRDLVDEHPDEDGSEIPDFPSRPQFRSEAPMLPRDAFFAKTETTTFKNAVGRISAELVTPYPPGIAAVAPGELYTEENVSYLEAFVEAGGFVEGASDPTLQKLRVVAD